LGDSPNLVGSFEITVKGHVSAQRIRYSTAVRHLQTDRYAVFEGIVSDRLQGWMQAQLQSAQQSLREAVKTQRSRPCLTVTELLFAQGTRSHPPLPVDRLRTTIPPALEGNVPFVLELAFELTAWGAHQLTGYADELVTCQIQTFAKPLSPISGRDHWRQSTAVPLLANKLSYYVQIPPASLGVGIYSLQILLLLSHLRSSPILLEIPALQVS